MLGVDAPVAYIPSVPVRDKPFSTIPPLFLIGHSFVYVAVSQNEMASAAFELLPSIRIAPAVVILPSLAI